MQHGNSKTAILEVVLVDVLVVIVVVVVAHITYTMIYKAT